MILPKTFANVIKTLPSLPFQGPMQVDYSISMVLTKSAIPRTLAASASFGVAELGDETTPRGSKAARRRSRIWCQCHKKLFVFFVTDGEAKIS
jgi:hypothetical protein